MFSRLRGLAPPLHRARRMRSQAPLADAGPAVNRSATVELAAVSKRYGATLAVDAVDLRIPGWSSHVVRRVAMELRMGGVGYYPRADFVHVDVGPVRYW